MTNPAVLNTIGLLLNLAGVVLLFAFGMPFRSRTGGASHLVLEQRDEDAIRAEKRNDILGWIGLGFIVVGTMAMIAANWI